MGIQTTHSVSRETAEKIVREIIIRKSPKPDVSEWTDTELEDYLENHDPSIFRNYIIATADDNTGRPCLNSVQDYFMYGEPK